MANRPIDCIRVDGASDEGPSHVEVQFHWTDRHVKHAKVATLVTSRHSGGSYLNRVELMNGGLSQAHANLFIPSTLSGSNYGRGGLDKVKLKKIWKLPLRCTLTASKGLAVVEAQFNSSRGQSLICHAAKSYSPFSKATRRTNSYLKPAIQTFTGIFKKYGMYATGT